MPPNPAFGRRATAQTTAKPRRDVRAEAKTPEPPAAEVMLAPAPQLPSLDDELREWKKNRTSGFQIPWRQISLMASLCFGIASLVLPDSVNGAVNWLLYGLTAVSFITGISRRRKRTA